MPQNGGLIRTPYQAERLLIWAGQPGWAGGWRAEVAEVEFGGGALRASGTELD